MAVGSSGGLAVVVMLVEEKVCRFYWPSFVDIHMMIRFFIVFFPIYSLVFFVCILVKASLRVEKQYFINVLLSANERNDRHSNHITPISHSF